MTRTTMIVLLAVAAVAACGGETRPEGPSGGKTGSVVEKPAFDKAAAASVTAIDLTEFKVTPAAASLKGPKVFLEVHNRSEKNLKHELVITKPGQTDEEPALAEAKEFPAGDERDLAVELRPGRYQFACFL